MSTSSLLTKTAGDMIAQALRGARIVAAEQSIENIDYQNGLDAMNDVIKQWQTMGVHLWARERAVLPLIEGQKSYVLGASGAKCGYEETFGNTTLSSDEGSGQTTLSVTSSSDMSVSDEIGIELDDGTRQWTTISSIPDSTSVTVDDSLTGDAASGNTVYFYTTQIDKPLRLDNVTYSSKASGSEIPCERWARQEYMDQPDKSSKGTVVNWYYNPEQSNGTLHVWQTASSVKNMLRFDVRKPLVVYGETDDTLEIPEEYFMALKWGIAAELGPEYGLSNSRQQVLEEKAFVFLERALDNDSEQSPVYFAPDMESY